MPNAELPSVGLCWLVIHSGNILLYDTKYVLRLVEKNSSDHLPVAQMMHNNTCRTTKAAVSTLDVYSVNIIIQGTPILHVCTLYEYI